MKRLLPLLLLMLSSTLPATPRYVLDLRVAPQEIVRGHLELGGAAPDGSSIAANSYYLERDGEPFIPIVGEFHFSRYPVAHWEESLRKMKAGGINTVASYVFWNLHERREGEFDFSGQLDLRHFLNLCAKVGLPAIVRIGPFCHGEIRNGGLPDWLYGRPFEVRSNDPGYLAHVDRLYAAIGRELRGLLFKDGGPVIGIQLENEYQHSAAPWELTYPGAPRELTVADLNRSVTYSQISSQQTANPYQAYGREHMARLKQLARKHGMLTPLYTATGWGNAAIVERGSLPVTAGYAYPFWAAPKPSPFYLFKDIHASPDYAPVSYEAELYPSIAAEMGSGIMPLYRRRPYFVEASLTPMMVRTVGSGSNGIGYYMYHGGSTPVFGHFYSEESSGLPKINYDFQAPIGEYGQVRAHYQALKPFHFFLESFAAELAPMRTVLPSTNAAIEPETTDVLRYAARTDGKGAFVFMQNFQDHLDTRDLDGLSLHLETADGAIRIPSEGEFSLRKDAWAVLPVNLDLGAVTLRSATVQPLIALQDAAARRHVFVSHPGIPPELVFPKEVEIAGEGIERRTRDGWQIVKGPQDAPFEFSADEEQILVVPYAMALQAYRVDEDTLVFSDALILEHEGFLECLARGNAEPGFVVYPRRSAQPRPTGATIVPREAPLPSMEAFALAFAEPPLPFSLETLSAGRFAVSLDQPALQGLHDVFLEIDYVGDRAMAFLDGALVADHFYHAKTWEIGLRRFADRMGEEPLILIFHSLRHDAEFLDEFAPEHRPAFDDGESEILRFSRQAFVPEYQAYLHWPTEASR